MASKAKPKLREPQSLAEAEKYIGRKLVKEFPGLGHFGGVVVAVDTELLLDEASRETERGLFYAIK